VKARLWLSVASAVLAGCAGAPESRHDAPAEPAPSAAAPDNRPAIVAFGDSLTAGFGLDPGKGYPDFLQRELDRRGYRYRVINAGISGETTTGGLARVGLVLADHPAIVILEFGGNDGLRGLQVAATRANLEQMIVELQKGGAKVVLAGMTLPPNYGPEYIRAFDRMYPDLAGRYELPLIPFLLAGVAGTAEYMQRDGLHPTEEGCRLVAANVMRVLEPLLSRPSN
jgi:acyl-CoA thioesterase-1